ncbi:hypothetical protein Nepgr_031421 [Nepenthes gracilis]|uniref:BAHD acyltransferase DCR n=1 Tax=Nepenthes gracilis TaxID=150966 RepID=A0AAD3Y548_NEPGR|nr:hypothetical protein Nepgr_031421 [Nepenthes gracilis]
MADGVEKKQRLKVKETNKAYVRPRKKLGIRECRLVTFDLPYLAFYYNQKLMIYRGDEYEKMAVKLKESLSLVLEEFYPLAGKLAKDDDGVFKVEYDDGMDGVEVAEAVAAAGDDGETMSVDDLIAMEDMSFSSSLVPFNGVLNLEGLHRPLLGVQLTKLRDGVVIGCGFNHAVLDGTSTWHFMSSWAKICSGATTTVSVPPLHDRTKVRNTRVKLNLALPSHAPSKGDHHPSNGSTANGTPEPPPLREKISDGSKPFSTFQSLSVHIWRAVTTARQLNPEDHTVFTIFADCRKRVDPPMPESYFGNLIHAIFTVTAAGLLLANPPEFGAGMIQKTIEAHDAKAIERRNEDWEGNPIIFQYKDAGVNCVAVGSSPRFKVYDADFGWGAPRSVRSGSNNKFDGMVYLYPGKSGGRSIDVEISLEGKAMEYLEKDKEFLMEEP